MLTKVFGNAKNQTRDCRVSCYAYPPCTNLYLNVSLIVKWLIVIEGQVVSVERSYDNVYSKSDVTNDL